MAMPLSESRALADNDWWSSLLPSSWPSSWSSLQLLLLDPTNTTLQLPETIPLSTETTAQSEDQEMILCAETSWREIASILLNLVLFSVILIVLGLWCLRFWTRRRLETRGLPTVYWSPRFFNYQSAAATLSSDGPPESLHASNNRKMSSSTITNILPRMQRLQGPFGMYGTVYGISTKVIHVGHPVPATALLTPRNLRSSSFTTNGLSPSAVAQPRRSWTGLSQRGEEPPPQSSSSTASTKAPAYNHFKDFCGQGVFTADGADWKAKRAAVMHALFRIHNTSFEATLEPLAHQAADQLIQQLLRGESDRTTESHVSSSNTTSSGTNDAQNIVPLLQQSTVGLVFEYITGCNLQGTLQRVEDEEREHTRVKSDNAHDESSLMTSYRDSITRIRMIILAQSRSVWFLLPRKLYKWCSALYQQEKSVMGPIRTFSTLACRVAKPHSSLGTLRQQALYQNEPHNDKAISQNLLDEAITLLFAGQDTSAATLSWTLHLLSLYPTVQERLYQEIASGPQIISKKNLSHFPYLDAVVKEAMRLYPVAPFVVRNVTQNLTLSTKDDDTQDHVQNDSVTLPSGSFACIWIYALHRHPDFWRRPNDFWPERWLFKSDHEKDKGMTTPGAYMPFCLGPRNCLGQPFAHVVLRILLGRLVAECSFHDDRLKDTVNPDSLRKDMQAGFTVLPQNGVFLRVAKRR